MATIIFGDLTIVPGSLHVRTNCQSKKKEMVSVYISVTFTDGSYKQFFQIPLQQLFRKREKDTIIINGTIINYFATLRGTDEQSFETMLYNETKSFDGVKDMESNLFMDNLELPIMESSQIKLIINYHQAYAMSIGWAPENPINFCFSEKYKQRFLKMEPE